MGAIIFLSAALVAGLVFVLQRKLSLMRKYPHDPTRARLVAWMVLATLAEVGAVAVMLKTG